MKTMLKRIKKLHFRRFFRPTTTTRGGSTAKPPPELHHEWRRFPWLAAHMCMADHMSINPSTHPLFSPLHISFKYHSISLTFAISFHQGILSWQPPHNPNSVPQFVHKKEKGSHTPKPPETQSQTPKILQSSRPIRPDVTRTTGRTYPYTYCNRPFSHSSVHFLDFHPS